MTMLDRMRRHKGWLKWSLGLVVLAFVAFYIPSFLDDRTAVGVGAAPTEVIADVDYLIIRMRPEQWATSDVSKDDYLA